MNNSKRAQAQIITTVLIILLVLAAVVIVWQVVNMTVKSGGEEITSQSSCIGMNLVVVSADATTGDVLIRRDPGAEEVESVVGVVFVNGENQDVETESLEQLGTDTVTVTLNADDEVQVAAKFTDGTVCPLSDIVVATGTATS